MRSLGKASPKWTEERERLWHGACRGISGRIRKTAQCARIGRLLLCSPFFVALTACQSDGALKSSGIISSARHCYQRGHEVECDALLDMLLSQSSTDILALSNASELAVEYRRLELSQRLTSRLDKLVLQAKLTELLLRLFVINDFHAIDQLLKNASADAVPQLLREYLELVLACELNDQETCREQLMNVRLPGAEQGVYRQLFFGRMVRELWTLDERKQALALLETALEEYPDAVELLAIKETVGALNSAREWRLRKRRRTQAIANPVRDMAMQDTEGCIGRGHFSGVEVWGAYPVCPENSAVFGTLRSESLYAVCCPLPSEDILSGKRTYRESLCPEDSIVTAAVPRCDPTEQIRLGYLSCPLLLECSELNRDRYTLGPVRGGIHWGEGSTFWLESRSIPKARIPSSIRTAMGRVAKNFWDTQGCVGYPFGAVLVGKDGKYCQEQQYRTLLRRKSNVDDLEPLQMMSACALGNSCDGSTSSE